MGGFNGNGMGWDEDRNARNRSRGQRRAFLERSLENLEDRRMLDGSGVASNFGDYYMFQNQKQALLRSGSELVIQFAPGQKDSCARVKKDVSSSRSVPAAAPPSNVVCV